MSSYVEKTYTVRPDQCLWHHRTSNGTSSQGSFFTDESGYRIGLIWDGNSDSYAKIVDYNNPSSVYGAFCFHLNTSVIPKNALVTGYTSSQRIAYGTTSGARYNLNGLHYFSQPSFGSIPCASPSTEYGGNSIQTSGRTNLTAPDAARTAIQNNSFYMVYRLRAMSNLDTHRRFFEMYFTFYCQIYTYTVTVKANGNGTVSGGGNYEALSKATIKAVAADGYRFVKWNDGNTSATRTVDVVSDVTYTATFEKIPQNYYLDLNGYLDEEFSGNISGYGTVDIYINGSKVATGVTDFYTAYVEGSTYEIRNIQPNVGKKYNGLQSGSLSGTITGNTAVRLNFTTEKFNIDLNGWLDGKEVGNIGGYGTADIYINGALVSSGATDFYNTYNYGTTYEIKNIQAVAGKKYNGVHSGYLSGSLNSNMTVVLDFSTAPTGINKIRVGGIAPKEIYIGGQPVKQVYLGNTLLYSIQ